MTFIQVTGVRHLARGDAVASDFGGEEDDELGEAEYGSAVL